jgi:hypothetical protein
MSHSPDITPKERTLKMLRQALLYQSPNKFPNLDLESVVIANESPFDLEEFYLRFNNVNYSSFLVASRYEAIDAIFELMQNNGWNEVYTCNAEIAKWLLEVGVAISQPDISKLCIHRCERLVSKTGTIAFSLKGLGTNPFTAIKNHVVIAYNSEVQEVLNAEAMGDSTLLITGGNSIAEENDNMRIWLFIINKI